MVWGAWKLNITLLQVPYKVGVATQVVWKQFISEIYSSESLKLYLSADIE